MNMQRTNSEIRKMARQALEGNWMKAVLAVVIALMLPSVLTTPFGYVFDNPVAQQSPGIIINLLCLPLTWGFAVFFLRIVRMERTDIAHLFDGYRDFVRVFVAVLLMCVYILLWALLLLIPGIIKSLSYAMTPYILKDNPEMGGEEAIHRSRVLMDGHKMKLFLLYLSFLGWALLCCITLGLGFFLLIPYVETSVAVFYETLLEEERAKMALHAAPASEESPVEDMNIGEGQ